MVVLQELQTVAVWPEAGEEIKPQQSKKRFESDFDLSFYADRDVSREELRRHIEAWLGEKLMQPRREGVWIGKYGELDPNYLVLMRRAIDYWEERGDKKAVRRFESELAGMQNTAKLIAEVAKEGLSLPVVVSASDPGDFYVDPEGRKKSVTFVGVLEKEVENGWQYAFFALPTSYIGLEEHKKILEKLADIERTKQILGFALSGDLTAEALVAYPMLLSSLAQLDEVARELGFLSWEEVEKKAADQLTLESDCTAKRRRELLVDKFVEWVEWVVAKAEVEVQKAIVEAMSEVFAFEAGAVYVGWSERKIEEEIKMRVKLKLAKRKGGVGEFYSTIGWQEWQKLLVYQGWVMSVFYGNEAVREAMVTGCGGGGVIGQGWVGDVFRFPYGKWSGVDSWLWAGRNSRETGSIGKYPEHYDYRPGYCPHCHEFKPYVAHPKSQDTKCAGWCTDCET